MSQKKPLIAVSTFEQITVLLAEDDPFATQAIASYLRRASNIELVATARDGHQCLSLLEQIKPDVILTDLGMKPMDGLELLAHLREDPSAPPAVCYTRLLSKTSSRSRAQLVYLAHSWGMMDG